MMNEEVGTVKPGKEKPRLKLSVLPDEFSICRLERSDGIPAWALAGSFFSITKTAEELSIVCPAVAVSEGTKCERGWRCLKVAGPLQFNLTGILSSLAQPLAQAGVSIFAVSTYDTDYLLVKGRDLARTVEALQLAGHEVKGQERG